MRKARKSLAIYNPYLSTKGGGEKVALALAEMLSHDYDVTLISREKENLAELGGYFALDLSKCRHVVLAPSLHLLPRALRKLHAPARLTTLFFERHDYKRLKKMGFDVFVNNCYKSNMPNPSKQGVYMCMFPQEYFNKKGLPLKRRLYHTAVDIVEWFLYRKRGPGIIDSYSKVTVNSQYTLGWTKKLWGMPEENIDILYPICDDMSDGKKTVKKDKVILHVGRFFANSGENHYKCQDKLLETFANMKDLHEAGWELHFVGSVADDADSLKYTLSLVEAARDLPIFLHMNAPFPELKSMFQKATIYWHATGWGSDADKHPEKQEHFGISTVEAMSTGTVPVVIDSAGQRETVESGKNGFRWTNKAELESSTRKVAGDSRLASELSRHARKDAARFGKSGFKEQVDRIFSDL